MRISLTSPKAVEFACHSKECAPPPAGHGGSSPDAKAFHQKMRNTHRQTAVTPDGKILVNRYGGKSVVFKTRSGKTSPWRIDKETTKASRLRSGE